MQSQNTIRGVALRMWLAVQMRKALWLMFAMAALWFTLALIRDATTLHLGPVVVAGGAAVMAGLEEVPRRDVLALAALGTVVALSVTALLSVVGMMDGPSLLPVGGAALESVLFAIAAGVVGGVAGAFATTR
ncbi:MAG: hypothetical protein HKN07_13285 [Acidimicrobiia bacterium]|nr:hypothetical protein [Acidimicrobiia bacterium]